MLYNINRSVCLDLVILISHSHRADATNFTLHYMQCCKIKKDLTTVPIYTCIYMGSHAIYFGAVVKVSLLILLHRNYAFTIYKISRMQNFDNLMRQKTDHSMRL